jgi:hypothetical protein
MKKLKVKKITAFYWQVKKISYYLRYLGLNFNEKQLN